MIFASIIDRGEEQGQARLVAQMSLIFGFREIAFFGIKLEAIPILTFFQ